MALWIDMRVAGATLAAISIGGILAVDKLGLVHETKQIDPKFYFFSNWYSIVWLVLYFTLFTYFGHGKHSARNSVAFAWYRPFTTSSLYGTRSSARLATAHGS